MDKKQIISCNINSIVNYWYDNNGNRFRKQDSGADEVYVLGLNGETEAVFNVNGTINFFNILSGNEIIGRFIPAPPIDLYLSNTTLSGTYEAQNTITVESNVTVSGTATLRAGTSIHLKPDFISNYGSNFKAKIEAVTNTAKRYYYLKDHLGSIRVTVNEAGEIVSYDDYDPWGMILTGRSGNEGFANDKYKFAGKERDVETGWDYLGARFYDSRIGIMMQADPLFEKHPDYSPYNYVLNNPIILIDPDGRQVLVSDPFFNYGFGKGFFGTLESTVTGLYETVSHPIATGERMWQAVTHPGATLEAMGSAVGDWAGRLTSANPIESGEAFGEAAAVVGETLIGTKGASKISSLTKLSGLSKLSSVEKLVGSIGKFDRLKGGVLQGTIKGNIDDIFNSLSKGAKQIEHNRFELPDGTIITKYTLSTTGTPTIGINQGEQLYKIRVVED